MAVQHAAGEHKTNTPGNEDGDVATDLHVALQNEALEDQVQAFQEALEVKEERLRTIAGELTAARRELERAKKSAKFDLVAAEGRTKKLGILEHTVATLRHDLHTNVERRQKVEEKVATLERSWQNERSLRLQDLHRHDAMSSDTKHAEKVAEDVEGRWLESEKRAQVLEVKVEQKIHELESQSRVNAAQAGEIEAQAAEIELHRKEIFDLKQVLLAREGEISTGCSTATDLRRELSRVRREFIMSTSNRSEQQSALLGSRRRGISSQRRRHPDRDSSTKELIAGGGHDLCRKENSRALQKARVSWDNVFMTKADQSAETVSDHRNSSGLNKSNAREIEKPIVRHVPHSSPPGMSGLDNKFTKSASFIVGAPLLLCRSTKRCAVRLLVGFVKRALDWFLTAN
ncbi:expressed unknown protein [Ectocarpus siliculosus]|uniref:Uncharacterized protein n=1 Tax=Ectocarpus siliculosus TaxID=2880 RepID=D7FYL7_ECTSI|nr:expressed unknown protein [Ectocarpus siliculosus]|eukprot:CBJ32559.1 expressed unknown protein [Ectocarpus siliculosus]